MKQVAILFAGVVGALLACAQIAGAREVVIVVYGAIALMALLISATFAWLWRLRATPLALGMSMSWAGTGLTLGWWWRVTGAQGLAPHSDTAVLLVFLSLLIAGAVLHFSVIQGTFGLRGVAFAVPVLGALAVSLGVLLLV